MIRSSALALVPFAFFAFVGCSGSDDAAPVADAAPETSVDTDSSAVDSGAAEDSAADATAEDTGADDTGSSDTGSSDTGSSDTGSSDTGASDTGSSDTGSSDTGSSDTGSGDAATPGFGGTITLSVPAVACASKNWCVESSSIMTGFSDLHGGVSASGPNDIWWGGVTFGSSDDASIVHFDGSKWQRVKLPSSVAIPGSSIRSVWAQSATNVWFGLGFGGLLHFDGTKWTLHESHGGSRAARGIWGSSATDFWVAYEGGTIVHHEAGKWTPHTVVGKATDTDYFAIGGTSASNVWAVGEAGTVQRWNGTAWSLVASATTESLVGLYVAGPSALVAVPFSSSEYPQMYNGTMWSAPAFPEKASSWLRSVHGRSASDVYVGDEAGAVRHWNGTTWTVAKPATTGIRGIYAAPSGDVWAIGPQVIAHYAP